MKLSLWDRLRAHHGLLFMWVLVWLFTMSSVVVNCTHAFDAMGENASVLMRVTAVVVAGFFPFAGLVMTEAVLIMIRSWRVSHWWITVMQGLLVLAGGVMLVVAFWRSFNALTEMAVLLAMPATDAWMLPVLTDTGIVVGTLGVVLAEVKMKLDEQLGSEPVPVDEAGRHRVQVLDEQPVDRAVEPDELIDLAPVEVRTSTPVEQDDRPVELVDHSLVGRPVELVEHDSDELVEDCSELAEQVRSSTGITADAVELAQVLAMVRAGQSRQSIADAVGRPKSTVSGWIKAADGVGALDRPRLAAVR